MKRVLIYGGKTGWIGGLMAELVKKEGLELFLGEARIENRESVAKELDDVKPTHVLMAAGITGRVSCEPNTTYKRVQIFQQH